MTYSTKIPNVAGWWYWKEAKNMKPERLLIAVAGTYAEVATDEEVAEALGIPWEEASRLAELGAFNYWETTDCSQMGGLWMRESQPWNKEWHDKFKAESGADILLFRIGDFYEAFFEDAKWTAKCLGLTLTTRNPKGSKPEIPMTGFPYHQLDAYTAKIVSLGKRVAICEQVK